jgi:hypothetical protein
MGRGKIYHVYEGQNIIGRGPIYHGYGGQNTMGRGRYTMSRRADIKWVGWVNIPWLGERYTMYTGVKITGRGPICHGCGGQNTMGRSIYHELGGRYKMGRVGQYTMVRGIDIP